MAGYSAIAFPWRCLLHVSEKVLVDCCVWRGRGGISGSSLFCPVLGLLVGRGLVGTSWGGTLPVLTCYKRFASSSPLVAARTCGVCGVVGVVPVLADARQFARASRLAPGVDIVGSCVAWLWCLTPPVVSIGGLSGGVSSGFSVGDVGTAVLAPGPSVRLISRSLVRFGVRVGGRCCCAAADAQFFVVDSVAAPE